MKNSKRILAVLLTVVMVMGCMAAYTFTSAAESIDLTAQSYITMGNGGNVTELLTNGSTGDYCDLGFWTNDNVSNPPIGIAGKCYIQIDLGTLCTVDSVWAVNLGGRNYKWDIYYSDDVSKDISTWTKVDGKTNDDECTADGYTVEFGTPITAKYIRLYGMYNSANIGYHFCEVKVMGAMVDPNAELEFDGVVKEPTETVEITLGPSAFGQWENWGSKTNALTGLTAGEGGAYNGMIMDGLKSGAYTAKVTLTDETAGKTYIIPQYFFDSPSHEIYNAVPHFFRFVFAEYNIPLVVGNAYTIAMEIYKGDKLLFKGATPEGQFSDWTKAPEILVPETVPHDYIEPGEEPPAPTIPELTIKPYTGGGLQGVENWPASDLQTNLLVQTAKSNGDFRNNTWVLTIDGEEYTMAVASVGAIGTDYIYRFHICLADKPYIPEVGTEFTVSAKIYDGETLVATTTEAGGFAAKEAPIVPAAPEPPVEPEGPTSVIISPYDPEGLNGFQNWDGGNGNQTQLLICTDQNVDEGYTWKLTIVKDSTGETKVITAKCSSAYDTWLRRFEVCTLEGNDQFVPEVGEYYTISAEIYNEAGELVMVADEADGFCCGEEPIVPTTPEPPVEPDEPIDPPQTGDAAIFATILVAVAAVALAVVFKKRNTI